MGRFQASRVRRRSLAVSVERVEPRLLLAASAAADVLTYHNDNARTGADPNETILNPSNVNPADFGKVFSDATDGPIYGQPLYMANVSIPGQGVHNVIFVTTENDSVYAFDADTPGPALWHVNFTDPAAGVTAVPSVQPWQLDITPSVGITGTPVIDPAAGTLYVAAKIQVTTAPGKTQDVYTLHALDVSTGAEKFGGPVVIQPTVPGRGEDHAKGVVPFDAYHELQRPALLLENGVVYVAFGSVGGQAPYHGWVVGYAANSLQQVAVFNTTPNSNDRSGSLGGIWMDGEGPSADAAGAIYLLTGSGPFAPARVGGNYSDAALKLTPSLKVADYFAPQNTTYLDKHDLDLGSGGSILVPTAPGSSSNLMIGGGKVGILFSINTANMGHQKKNNRNVQAIPNANAATSNGVKVGNNPVGAIFTSPAYSNGMVYINAVGDVLRQYAVVNGKLVGPLATSSKVLGYPGANLTVSSDGASNGIVWSVEDSGTRTVPGPAVLHAYNAADVAQELYNSADAGARDQAGSAVKFAVPTVANGEVYVATQSGITVYGLLG